MVYKSAIVSATILIMQHRNIPLKPTLEVYKDVDILNSFITVVKEIHTTPLLPVPITAIQGKVIFVKNQVCTCIIKLPNQFEHH